MFGYSQRVVSHVFNDSWANLVYIGGNPMTAHQMTRKKALELAQKYIQREMQRLLSDAVAYYRNDGGRQDQYAELAEALKVIENMARQKEMHL